jgi:biotin synthase-like enzyme
LETQALCFLAARSIFNGDKLLTTGNAGQEPARVAVE